MKRPPVILAFGLTALIMSPAVAQNAVAPGVFEIVNVSRDSVPAGTPAAFYTAFPNAERNAAQREVGEDNYLFVPLAFIPLSDTRVALISTGANDCSGQSCTGLNAVHYFDHAAGSPGEPYTQRGEWLDVGAVGTLGNPARHWGWSRSITGTPVLYTEAGGGWQGRHCSYAVLTELAESGPVEIARIRMAFSDATTEEAEADISGLITAADDRSLTVSYTGSSTFAETWRRGADGRYRLQGDSRLPAC